MAKVAVKKGFYGTGRRKTAVARVWLAPGTGEIQVNAKPFAAYFGRQTALAVVQQPFEATGLVNKYNVSALLAGGGSRAQAEALRHGISRALLTLNPDLRKPLKVNGLLTRDPREKERRKVGRRKARRRPQYSKR